MGLISAIFGTGQVSATGDAGWWPSGIGARKTRSGEIVGPDRGMTLSAYWACQQVIAQDIAKVPFIVQERVDDKTVRPLPNHRVTHIFDQEANSRTGAKTFRQMLTHWKLGWGGGVGEIQFDRNGLPVGVVEIHPAFVEIKPNDDGDPEYHIRDYTGVRVRQQSEMFHVRGLMFMDIPSRAITTFPCNSTLTIRAGRSHQ